MGLEEKLVKIISKKYPKVLDMIIDFLRVKTFKSEPENNWSIWFVYQPLKGFCISTQFGIDKIYIPFEMLYGLLEDFFIKKEFNLYVKPIHYCFENKTLWTYYFEYESGKIFNNKIEAQYELILKACKAYNNKIYKGK